MCILWWLGESVCLGQGAPMATPQRPTFTTDTSTATPGTLELEMGAQTGQGVWSAPLNWKFTPDVKGGFFHRGEFRVSFDSLVRVDNGRRVDYGFGDRIVIGWRKPIYQNTERGISFAVAPRVSAMRHPNQGARFGFTTVMVKSWGRTGWTVNGTGSGATKASPATGNPGGLFEFDSDLARQIGADGVWSRVGVFVGVHAEKGRRQNSAVALGQGITFRARNQIVLDFAVRQVGLADGRRDLLVLFGMTANFGRVQSR